MSEYITLLGAEDVQRAGHTISAAADRMAQAASSIDHTMEMFLRHYEELISRQMRVKEVVQKRDDDLYHVLPIVEANATPDGVVIVVGSWHG